LLRISLISAFISLSLKLQTTPLGIYKPGITMGASALPVFSEPALLKKVIALGSHNSPLFSACSFYNQVTKF